MPTPVNPQTPEQILAMLRNQKGVLDAAPVSEGQEWADGRYRVRIEHCVVSIIDKGSLAGNARFKWTLRGLDAPYKDRLNFQDIPLLDEKSSGRIKGRFKAIGMPYATTEDCANSAATCAGRLIEIKLRTGKSQGEDRQYCDFIRALGDEAEANHVAQIAAALGQPGKTTAAAAAQAEIDALAAAMTTKPK